MKIVLAFFYSHVKGRVLVALADGTISIFHRDTGIISCMTVIFYVIYISLFVLPFIIYRGVIIVCCDSVVMISCTQIYISKIFVNVWECVQRSWFHTGSVTFELCLQQMLTPFDRINPLYLYTCTCISNFWYSVVCLTQMVSGTCRTITCWIWGSPTTPSAVWLW